METVCTCPSCGQRYRLKPQTRAAQVRCRKCGAQFAIPAQSEPAPIAGEPEPDRPIRSLS